MRRRVAFLSSTISGIFLVALILLGVTVQRGRSQSPSNERSEHNERKDLAAGNAAQLVKQGRRIFRFDTFGDQAFWGDTLKLYQAIERS